MNNTQSIIASAIENGIGEDCLKNSVLCHGNNAKILSVLKKAEDGKELKIGFLCGTVAAQSGYVDAVFGKIKSRLSTEPTLLNCTKENTGSLIGVHRMNEELLSKRPDLVFVDFSADDTVAVDEKEAYEGILRKALISGAAVVSLCVCGDLNSDVCVSHRKIAEHYGVPVIACDTKRNNVSAFLSTAVEYLFAALSEAETEEENSLPQPLYSDIFVKSLMTRFGNVVPFDAGSFGIYHGFPQFDDGWVNDGGKPISFEITHAKEAYLMILSSPDDEMGAAEVIANGQKTEIDCHSVDGSPAKAVAVKIFSSDTPQYVRVTVTPKSADKKFIILRILKAYDYEFETGNLSGEELSNELVAKTLANFDKTVAVLCDERPGFDETEADRVIAFLRKNGYYVHKISVDYLCTKRKERIGAFLLIPNASSVPAVCAEAIDNYWKQGGMVFTLGGVLFAKYVDKVDGKWTQIPLKDNEFDAVLSKKAAPIVIEGITPTYKTYRCNNATEFFGIENIGGSGTAFRTETPLNLVSPVARPTGVGFKMEHKNRFIPLVGISGESDRTPDCVGTAAFMMLSDTRGHLPTTAGNRVGNVSDTTCGSLIASIGITEQNIMDIEGVPETMLFMFSKMQDGLFIFEGGADKYAYSKDDRVTFGAKVLNITQDFKRATVRITLKKDGKTAYSFEKSLLTSPRKFTEFEFFCDNFVADDYKIKCELIYNNDVIDEVSQEISVYVPCSSSNPDDFVKVENGDFILNKKKWYPFGINYWPLYCPSIERNQYWIGWLDKSNYIPDEVEKDLVCMERLGLNSLFIRLDGISLLRFNSSFKDFLMRCRKHNFKILLSYPNATCPVYYYPEAFLEVMKEFELSNDPIIFSHDISWEIGHQPASPSYINFWDLPWKEWLEERYGSIENAERDFGVAVNRTPDGRVTVPYEEELVDEGPWNVKAAAFRRFIEDYFSKLWNIAVTDMKKTDPNHLISFRRGVLTNRSMAFNITNKHTDYSSLEGYYIDLGERDYHISCAHTALMQMLNGNRPVIWSEYGISLTGRSWEALFWDHEKEGPFDYRMKLVNDYIAQFLKMFKTMDVKGTAPWWWPGGFRTGEMSDNGFCGPDGALRPYAKNFVESKEWFNAERPKKNYRTVTVDPESYARSYHYLCTEVLWRESMKAEQEGSVLKTVTEATGTTSANVPLKAIGNVAYNGTNPPKYLNGEFNFVKLRVGDREFDVDRNGSVTLPKDEPVFITLGAGNLKEAKWLAPENTQTGGVYFVSTDKSDIAVKVPIKHDAEYLSDTESAETVLVEKLSEKTHVALRLEAENRAIFGEIFEFDIVPEGEVL